jgi:hypothetical protein
VKLPWQIERWVFVLPSQQVTHPLEQLHGANSGDFHNETTHLFKFQRKKEKKNSHCPLLNLTIQVRQKLMKNTNPNSLLTIQMEFL